MIINKTPSGLTVNCIRNGVEETVEINSTSNELLDLIQLTLSFISKIQNFNLHPSTVTDGQPESDDSGII